MKPLLSGGGNLNKLIFNGRFDPLLDLLRITQLGSLQTLQETVSDGEIVGYGTAGAGIARQPLFMRGMPALRTLTIAGCDIPLTCPILTRSPNLTSLSLYVPADSLEPHILDILKTIPRLRQLHLDFQGTLQPPRVTHNSLPLPFLSHVILKGVLHLVATTL